MTNPIFRKEDVLIEALPYIQQFEKTTFVIKYGGAVMQDEELKVSVAQDVTLLRKIGIEVVVVHGGGKEITSMADRLSIESKFVNGQRYTDENMRDIVQMVLAGSIRGRLSPASAAFWQGSVVLATRPFVFLCRFVFSLLFCLICRFGGKP